LERVQFRAHTYNGSPTWVRGRGCNKCKGLGYKGRIAVVEAMPNYHELENLILGRAASTQIKEQAIKCGMRSLRQNALSKAAGSQTTIEEVLRVTASD
jgi:type II secretory ATPase GspE/PulE/Tfp pilus assembly ATPase PilB-like protein